MTVKAEYLVDRKGHKKSAVLPIKIYQKLLEHIENLEDALDLKKAKKSAKTFVDFDQFAKQFKAQGRTR